MATVDRRRHRGTRRGLRILRELGHEFRDARVGSGLSQEALAQAVGMSQPRISRIERAELTGLSIVEAARVASVLGLELSGRLYPGGQPLRDAAHAERLQRLLRHARPPLRYRVDVALPRRSDAAEQRAWDAVLYANGRRTAIELEMRLRDIQATIRRHAMKRRDDPVDGFVLVLADSRTNRRIHAQYQDLWPDLPRLRTDHVFALLEAGAHPPSGIMFI